MEGEDMTEQIHVLYVDDEPDLLCIGKLFLEKNSDFKVTTCESALSAFDSLPESTFDAIISDYQMPKMDGIEFLKSVRSSGNTIPFILFTGRGREEVAIQALNGGADFYLQKGGDPRTQFAELIHKVRQAVKQRRLEASVCDHERREVDILNFLPDATFAINAEGIVIAWNQAMEKMAGIRTGEMLGKGDYEYALPFYHERRPMLINLVLNADPVTTLKYSKIVRDGEFLSSEITLPHFREGAGISLWFTASPLYNNRGTIVGAIESIRDITSSKRAEQELLQSHEELHTAYEEIYAADEELRKNIEKITLQNGELAKNEQQIHAIASNIPGVIYRLVVDPDRDLGFDYVSERSSDILGIKNDTATFSEELSTHIIPEDKERFLSSIQDAIATKSKWEFEGRYMKPSGEIIWINAVSSPIIEDGRYIFDGIIFDDTARREMGEFNRLLAKMSDDAPASITIHDFAGNMLYANEQKSRIHGYTREEFLAKNLHEIDVPESQDLIEERLKTIREKGEMEFDVNHYHKDGSWVPLHVHLKVIEWDGKNVLLSIATGLPGKQG